LSQHGREAARWQFSRHYPALRFARAE